MTLLLTACGPDEFLDRREMYANLSRAPKVRLEVDWQSHFGQKPTGMTVLMQGVGGNTFATSTNSVDGVDLSLNADTYPTLVYNLSPDEFGSMDFHNTDSYDSIHATLTPITMRANEAWDKDVKYMREPEDLGVALDTIEITPDMVNSYSAIVRQRLLNGYSSDKVDTVMYVFHEKPFPVISTLNIIVKVLGLKNAKSVEGNITNMANGFYLTGLHTTTGKGTHLLDNWKAYYEKGSNRDGYITTSIKTFGLPHGTENLEGRDSSLNYLTLYFNLVDDTTTRKYEYAVGDLFKYVKEEDGHQSYTTNVTLELDLRIEADSHGNTIPDLPDVTPSGGSSGTGFDAHVDDWEDGGTADVSM